MCKQTSLQPNITASQHDYSQTSQQPNDSLAKDAYVQGKILQPNVATNTTTTNIPTAKCSYKHYYNQHPYSQMFYNYYYNQHPYSQMLLQTLLQPTSLQPNDATNTTTTNIPTAKCCYKQTLLQPTSYSQMLLQTLLQPTSLQPNILQTLLQPTTLQPNVATNKHYYSQHPTAKCCYKQTLLQPTS